MSRVRFIRVVSAAIAAWALSTAFVLAQDKPQKAPADPDTVYNVQSHIYHRETCSAARRCTKNCIVIKLSEAKQRGGRACQICGGPATSSTSVVPANN
jgi:methylphosphotriester-DNA--protein-cysteine methyltransferase